MTYTYREMYRGMVGNEKKEKRRIRMRRKNRSNKKKWERETEVKKDTRWIYVVLKEKYFHIHCNQKLLLCIP